MVYGMLFLFKGFYRLRGDGRDCFIIFYFRSIRLISGVRSIFWREFEVEVWRTRGVNWGR